MLGPFLVPFVFTLSPAALGVLLQAPLGDLVRTAATASVGVGALAAGLGGWLHAPMRWPERLVATAAGLLLFYPGQETDLAGLGLFGGAVAVQVARSRCRSRQ